jgi:ABC-type glutathione transport system ATPase component
MSVAGKTAQTSASAEDRSGSIRFVGAREHNLMDVSLSIPKDRITAFVGVSGSGKSSIVFDTMLLEELRHLLRSGGLIALAHQPRGPGASDETSAAWGREMGAALAGFSEVRLETMALKPAVVCALGVNRGDA